jgi:putative DNA methylase
MSEPKKLIEVAMPIKEISAESVRDKSIRSGHISTLHLWWARRPLPVCRAVVFASLVPDPMDPNCPEQFKEVIKDLLGAEKNNGDPYKPYDDIPYTSAIDLMDDNLRNRLMMFIGKFSDKYIQGIKKGKSVGASDTLSEASLVKWENKNNELIIGKARKLIWVAHNSINSQMSATDLLLEFDLLYKAIKDAENSLYSIPNRHINSEQVKSKNVELQKAIDAFQNKMPKVFDPFAGGGAIPLEASRFGCRTYGNDINPVAHIIQKASLEFPQKYGKRINFTIEEFNNIYGIDHVNKIPNEWKTYSNGSVYSIEIPNRLAFDFETHAKKILSIANMKYANMYPKPKEGHESFSYLWSRVATCSNPTCKAKVPLISNFYISKPRSSKYDSNFVFLEPIIEGTNISFSIKRGITKQEPWINRGNVKCPCCSSITENALLKKQFVEGKITETLLAIVCNTKLGRDYIISDKKQMEVYESITEESVPKGKMHPCAAGGDTFPWGITQWEQLYNKRQSTVLVGFKNIIEEYFDKHDFFDEEYKRVLITYCAIWLDKIVLRSTSFGQWHYLQETVEHLFGRQTVSMSFSYPELNPFTNSSNGALGQLASIINYIENESLFPFISNVNNSVSGEKNQFDNKWLDAVITDPPYYDAIAYADVSDFFYLWLKSLLTAYYPSVFVYPQTPKTDECTALKHHHNDDKNLASLHFENKLKEIFCSLEHQTKDIVSIMFAHQSTTAWTTLCNSILGAKMNITGSWATDSEVIGALKTGKGYLASSVTIAAKPSQKNGIGNYREVKQSIEKTVAKEVEELHRLGFRGADLLTACFGQAVSEFGKYEKVEKADGSEVTVAELLEMARESAFNALLKGFEGDEFTKFYIGWLQLNGLVDTDFDDAAKFTKVGLSINVQDLFKEHILIKNGNKQHLGTLKERIIFNSKLGEGRNSTIIDITHKLMSLYGSNNRNNLLKFIKLNSIESDNPIWRVLTSLSELLPKDMEDHKLAIGLLTNKDQLIREAKSSFTPKPEQSQLTFE